MKGLVTCFLAVTFPLFQAAPVVAQAPFLDGLRILPENPNENDTIRISWRATTPNQGMEVGHSFSRSGNYLDIQGCYQQGFANAPSSFEDTIIIGILPQGDYQIRLLAYISSDTANCVPIDSNNIGNAFTVTDATGIDRQKLRSRPVLIFPNPARTVLQVFSDEGWQRLVIFDIRGRRIRTIQNTGSNQVNVSTITAGVYFLQIELKGRREILKLIKD